MRVLVTGGRHYHDVDRVFQALDIVSKAVAADASRGLLSSPVKLVVGDATGADTHAAAWAQARSFIEAEVFEADWDRHGPVAGPLRNEAMVNTKPDLCVAFPGGTGTHDTIVKCVQRSIPVLYVTHTDEQLVAFTSLVRRWVRTRSVQ